jgi:hypothetical protein
VTIPSFVNAGTRGSQSYGTTVSPALPASRVNGNLLVAVFYSGASGKVPVWPAGWTAIDGDNSKVSFYYAYRIVDGSETAPAITWTGNTSAHAYILQFTGTVPNAGAIGNFIRNQSASLSNLMTCPALATSAPNSLILMLLCNSNTTFSAGEAPAGFTAIFDSSNDEAAIVGIAAQGDSSPAVSQSTPTTNFWVVGLIELRSQIPGIPPLELAADLADDATLTATIGLWPPLRFSADFGDGAAFAAAITLLPAPLRFAADFADGAALLANLTVGAEALRLASGFADGAELAVNLTVGFQPHAPPIQAVVVLSF